MDNEQLAKYLSEQLMNAPRTVTDTLEELEEFFNEVLDNANM